MANITLFAQIISQLPKEKIRKIIKKSGTDKHSKGYNTWSQFVSMIFSQFSGCDSVRGTLTISASAVPRQSRQWHIRTPAVTARSSARYTTCCSGISDSRQSGNVESSVSRCR